MCGLDGPHTHQRLLSIGEETDGFREAVARRSDAETNEDALSHVEDAGVLEVGESAVDRTEE